MKYNKISRHAVRKFGRFTVLDNSYKKENKLEIQCIVVLTLIIETARI